MAATCAVEWSGGGEIQPQGHKQGAGGEIQLPRSKCGREIPPHQHRWGLAWGSNPDERGRGGPTAPARKGEPVVHAQTRAGGEIPPHTRRWVLAGRYSLWTKVMDGGFFGHISATSENFRLKLNMGRILRPERTFLACWRNQRVLIYHQYCVNIENHNFQLGPQFSFGKV
jgi:hypothetical protein